METLIYSLGVMTLCVSAISSITLFNIGSNVIMTNNNKNFFVNVGYLVGLFYTSILFGMLFTINIPWILLATVANSDNMNSTIHLFTSPILKTLSNSMSEYSNFKLNENISSILEDSSDEDLLEEDTVEDTVEDAVEEGSKKNVENDNTDQTEKQTENQSEVKCNLPDSPRDCSKCDKKLTMGSYFEIENCAGTSSCCCVTETPVITEEQKKDN
jgi:hypothetical protein